MSGGSHDYAYRHVANFSTGGTPLRNAFKAHLEKVAAAMKAIEWNDSGDGDDREDAMIRACISPDAEILAATKLAETALENLTEALRRATGGAA